MLALTLEIDCAFKTEVIAQINSLHICYEKNTFSNQIANFDWYPYLVDDRSELLKTDIRSHFVLALYLSVLSVSAHYC